MNVAWAIPILLILFVMAKVWDDMWDSDDEAEAEWDATPDPAAETASPDEWRPTNTWVGKTGAVALIVVAAATFEIGSSLLLDAVLDPVLEQIIPSDETSTPCVDLSEIGVVDSPTAAPAAPPDPVAQELARELQRQLGEPCDGQAWP